MLISSNREQAVIHIEISPTSALLSTKTITIWDEYIQMSSIMAMENPLSMKVLMG